MGHVYFFKVKLQPPENLRFDPERKCGMFFTSLQTMLMLARLLQTVVHMYQLKKPAGLCLNSCCQDLLVVIYLSAGRGLRWS